MTDYSDLCEETAEELEAAHERCAKLRAERDDARAQLASAETALQLRDRDWILAMAAALGTDSGQRVPIVPEVEPFLELFAALKGGA